MKQAVFKGKSKATQVILTLVDKTPEGFDIITEKLELGKL